MLNVQIYKRRIRSEIREKILNFALELISQINASLPNTVIDKT